MSYTINFTDNINNPPITVNDNTTNTVTSLGFPGRNQKGYGATIAENFLHLLENFANSSAPANPTKGQLWYDTANGVEELKVYDGTNWKAAGSLKKGSSQPEVASSIIGDVWVDTTNQQLYLYNGSSWILVGPTFSSGLQTGSKAEVITDSAHNNQIVLKNYVNDQVVSIISASAFTPITTIEGFTTIQPGVNLSTKLFSNNTVANKFWGTSEKAENLVIGNTSVPAVNFLRTDTANIATQSLTVRNDSGINIGAESQLSLRIKNQTAGIYQSTQGSALDLKVNVGGTETTLLRLDSTSGYVGVGPNNFSPDANLSVSGTGSFTGSVNIKDTTDTTNNVTGALVISGGASVNKKLLVGGDTTINGQLNLGYGAGDAILPSTNNVSNIGSSSYKFSNMYATTFNGNLIGNVTGNVTGNVNGTATSLISSTVFFMSGDVTSSGFSFDGTSTTVSAGSFVIGQQYKITTLGTTNFTAIGAASNTPGLVFTATGIGSGTGTATTSTTKAFVTSVAEGFITSKTATTTPADDDELLVYKQLVGLRKITKSNFLKNFPAVPIGAIFPFAGNSVSVPPGYLLCDGSEKQIGLYIDLYHVIGFTYTPDPGALKGVQTFKLPDLRGRFPLGLDNMDNADSVPDAAASPPGSTNIDSGGGPANRVTDSTASTLGNASGHEQHTLTVSQIPQHKHKLIGDAGTQFYATNLSTTNPPDTGAFLSNGGTSPSKAQYLNTTGNIDTGLSVGQPVNLMNPYLAINYIIYTGVYS